ncbi:MAG: arginyltransferase [Gammaproteobacteria bacterium]|nr:arginyltransferase [Gammaproteobacteria bacterium]
MTSSLRDLKVYTTYPHSCSYLEGQEATTLFVDPRTPVDGRLYSQLSALGFRRSGSHLYRPHCSKCNACIPARVPVRRFQPRRSQRRTWNRNQDVQVEQLESIATDEYFELYRRYIEDRHRDGDMYPPLRDQYESFLSDVWGVTEYYRLELLGQLAAVAVVDRLEDGLSAVYTFFEPQLHRRSLGTYSVLWQLRRAARNGLDYLYLGYWIKQCQKMSYKIQYRPLELYINGRWVDLL